MHGSFLFCIDGKEDAHSGCKRRGRLLYPACKMYFNMIIYSLITKLLYEFMNTLKILMQMDD